MNDPDRTFESAAAYGSNRWTATTLGVSLDTFFRKRQVLYNAGFPKPDSITNLYCKADVSAWIERRRKYADDKKENATITGSHQPTGANLDAV